MKYVIIRQNSEWVSWKNSQMLFPIKFLTCFLNSIIAQSCAVLSTVYFLSKAIRFFPWQ